MKIRKAIKKIIALGTGTAMVGATLMGAMAAADLGNYPSPFIKDGMFNSMIVVGDTAAPADIVGAIDVAASLQYNMKMTGYVSTGGSASTTVEGGANIETSSQKLWYGTDFSSVKATFDKDNLAFLADGQVTDEDGTDYTYKQYLRIPKAQIAYGDPESDLDKGVVYINFDTNDNWTAEIQFPTAINASRMTNKKINMFGKEFTFSSRAADLTTSKLVMYAAGLDQTFTAGDTTTVTVGNEDVDIEVIGVNTQTTDATATIKVNGESKSVTAGDNPTVGGVKIYVKDIFAYTAPVTSGAVRLFIGSDKYTYENGNAVTTGSSETDIEGTNVVIASAAGKVSKIAVETLPYSVEKGDETYSYVVEGESIVDPLFGTFKLAFTGVTPSLMDSSRDVFKIEKSGTEKVKLEFTNKNGAKYSLNVLTLAAGSEAGNVSITHMVDSRNLFATTTALTKIADEEYFVIDVDGYSRIMQVKKIDNSNNKVKLRDVGEGITNEYTISSGAVTMTFSEGDVTFDVYADDSGIENVSAIKNYVHTNNGMKITWPDEDSETTGSKFVIDEATTYNDASATDETTIVAYDNYNVTVDWDSTNSKAIVGQTTLFTQTGDGDDYTFLSRYGTYFKYNSDSDSLEGYYPKDINAYDVSFAPVDGTVLEVGGSGTVETVTIQKIAVGAAKLASEVADVTAQNLISVGGPCVNAVSAALMGNPANCAEGFTAGVAKVKLFEQTNGNVAMMIAGYSADDTKRATKVVSDFDQYDGFSGNEIEVSGTTMNDITVSAPVVTTTTTEVTTTTEEVTPGE